MILDQSLWRAGGWKDHSFLLSGVSAEESWTQDGTGERGGAGAPHLQYPADRVPQQLLDNQVLNFGQQFERVLRLKRHNFEVAIADSPLEQQQLYFEGHHYEKSLQAVIADCAKLFETYNVFIQPTSRERMTQRAACKRQRRKLAH
jgi:hypothetical protein